MRQALDIFKKDVRRMRWAIVLILALLAVLAREDSLRGESLNSPLEGWLNLFLPLVWSWVIALVVHQEPVHGDRQFWITRPYRWASLAAAKALFAVAFVLLPALAADMCILTVRHFQPFAHLPELIGKQLLIALAVVIPSMALATLTRNMVQFTGAMAVLTTAMLFTLGAVGTPAAPPEPVRRDLALWIVAPAALAIIVIQYFRRATLVSRIIGLAAVSLSALLFMFLPRAAIFAIQHRLDPPPAGTQVQINLGDRVESLNYMVPAPNRNAGLLIPLAHSPLPDGSLNEIEVFDLEIVAADGRRWKRPSSLPPFESRRELFLTRLNAVRDGLLHHFIILDKREFERFRGQRVTVTGRAGASIVRWKDAGSLPVGADSQPVPGLGRCSTRIEDSSWDSSFKAICESTVAFAGRELVTLVHPGGREWRNRFNFGWYDVRFLPEIWLSPLTRRQAHFRITERDPSDRPGDQWLLPRSMLDGATVRFRSGETIGYTYLNYELRDIDLTQFVLQQPH